MVIAVIAQLVAVLTNLERPTEPAALLLPAEGLDQVGVAPTISGAQGKLSAHGLALAIQVLPDMGICFSSPSLVGMRTHRSQHCAARVHPKHCP